MTMKTIMMKIMIGMGKGWERVKLFKSHKSGKRSQNLIDPCHARKTFEKFSG